MPAMLLALKLDLCGHFASEIDAKVLQDHLWQVVSKLPKLVSSAEAAESDQMSLKTVTQAEIANADSP